MGPSKLKVEGTSFKGTGSCQHLTASEAGRKKHIHMHPQARDHFTDRGVGRGRLSMASSAP